jgi:hypothetical protein
MDFIGKFEIQTSFQAELVPIGSSLRFSCSRPKPPEVGGFFKPCLMTLEGNPGNIPQKKHEALRQRQNLIDLE